MSAVFTVQERLADIRNYIACEDWKSADFAANDMWEEFELDLIKLTEDEENCLFCYIDKISNHYYGFDRMWDKKPEDSIWNVFN